jgi:chromosome segregation ATPase
MQQQIQEVQTEASTLQSNLKVLEAAHRKAVEQLEAAQADHENNEELLVVSRNARYVNTAACRALEAAQSERAAEHTALQHASSKAVAEAQTCAKLQLQRDYMDGGVNSTQEVVQASRGCPRMLDDLEITGPINAAPGTCTPDPPGTHHLPACSPLLLLVTSAYTEICVCDARILVGWGG